MLEQRVLDAFVRVQYSIDAAAPAGRANFPLMLLLYVGALTPFIYGVLALEWSLERNLVPMLLSVAVTMRSMRLWLASTMRPWR